MAISIKTSVTPVKEWTKLSLPRLVRSKNEFSLMMVAISIESSGKTFRGMNLLSGLVNTELRVDLFEDVKEPVTLTNSKD